MNDTFKIISTLGPASMNGSFLETCRQANQLNFRLNGSHLDITGMNNIIRFIGNQLPGAAPDITLDLQGAKMRTGQSGQTITLTSGQLIKFAFISEPEEGIIPLPHQELFQAARKGDMLLLQDGTITAKVVETTPTDITAQVETAGELRPGCGIQIADKEIYPERISDEQQQQAATAAQQGVQNLAISYLRSAKELENWRTFLRENQFSCTLTAKIEHPGALENLEALIEIADVVWYCRGDLGTFIHPAQLGYWQDKTIELARKMGKPLFIAGQVFHHLTHHPQPTRSEVVHLYHIQKQGIRGIVLSDETAIGQNPVQTMKYIADMVKEIHQLAG